jgi:O-antigen/teichoic acid export membrane protein
LQDYARSASLFGLLALQNDYDKAVLVQYGFLSDLGYYAAAYRLVGFIEMPQGQLIAAAYRPVLQLARDKPQDLPREVYRLVRVLIAYGILAVVAVVAGYPFAAPLLGEYGPVLRPLLMALVPVIVLRGIGAACSNALIGLGRINLSFWATALAAPTSIALYYALIPAYSWGGAVAGTLGGELVAAAFMVFSLRRTVGRRVGGRGQVTGQA